MGAVAVIEKRAVWLAHHIVNLFVLSVILLLLVFGCYAMWDTGQVHSAAEAVIYAKYKPTAEDDGISFKELQAINPEVFAWLTVYGTHVDYPVVQNGSNLKYLNTNAYGKYSLSGAIFLDYRNSPDFSDFNSIFYGHHMEKQTMFGEIGDFAEKSYFDDRRYGTLFHSGREHGLEFFAFAHADAYDSTVFRPNITELAEREAYLESIFQAALHVREDAPVTAEDRIVLLSTCSEASTNGRSILLGRITDEVFGDPFAENPGNHHLAPAPAEGSGIIAVIPLWVIHSIAILPFLLIFLAVGLVLGAFPKRIRCGIRQRGRWNGHGQDTGTITENA